MFKSISELENSKYTHFIIGVFLVSILIASIYFGTGSSLHSESQSFLLNYLDNRPFIQKIFDVQKNDWGFYQARELSYVFDYIDANFITMLIRAGFPVFYSLTYYLGLILILLLLPIIAFRYFRLKSPLLYAVLTALFLTAPATFFSNSFFRSSKILVAVFTALLIYIVLRLIKKPATPRNSRLSVVLLIVVGFLLSISDRQGYFMLLSFTAISFLIWILKKERGYQKIFFLLLVTAGLAHVYTYVIGPFVITSLTGFRPDLSVLKIDFLTFTRQDPLPEVNGFIPKLQAILLRSLLFFLDTIGYFFGNLNSLLVLFGLILVLFLLIKMNKNYFPVFLSSLFLLFIMFFFMLVKQPQMVWPGVRRIYYTLPVNLLILVFSLFLASRLLELWPKLKNPLLIILAFAFISNLLSLPSHLYLIQYGVQSDEYKVHEYAPRLRLCLLSSKPSVSSFQLPPLAEKVCQSLRKK
jgi:hypothetical protein